MTKEQAAVVGINNINNANPGKVLERVSPYFKLYSRYRTPNVYEREFPFSVIDGPVRYHYYEHNTLIGVDTAGAIVTELAENEVLATWELGSCLGVGMKLDQNHYALGHLLNGISEFTVLVNSVMEDHRILEVAVSGTQKDVDYVREFLDPSIIRNVDIRDPFYRSNEIGGMVVSREGGSLLRFKDHKSYEATVDWKW
jgi:hypothetical protein